LLIENILVYFLFFKTLINFYVTSFITFILSLSGYEKLVLGFNVVANNFDSTTGMSKASQNSIPLIAGTVTKETTPYRTIKYVALA
jgi:hypothetical protein